MGSVLQTQNCRGKNLQRIAEVKFENSEVQLSYWQVLGPKSAMHLAVPQSSCPVSQRCDIPFLPEKSGCCGGRLRISGLQEDCSFWLETNKNLGPRGSTDYTCFSQLGESPERIFCDSTFKPVRALRVFQDTELRCSCLFAMHFVMREVARFTHKPWLSQPHLPFATGLCFLMQGVGFATACSKLREAACRSRKTTVNTTHVY